MSEKKYILTKEVIERKLRRMALEIAERNYNESSLLLIGIKEKGLTVANKISLYIKEVFTGEVSMVALSLNKDLPGKITIHPEPGFDGKAIVLIDDVANSGKTMLYALRPLLEAYPKKIQTLALVERTHKSFPVQVDYTGVSVSTNRDEHIHVDTKDGEITGAWLESM
jgi:pyrimidine operon attenuation protein/uracil phosphoribosyltransferase